MQSNTAIINLPYKLNMFPKLFTQTEKFGHCFYKVSIILLTEVKAHSSA